MEEFLGEKFRRISQEFLETESQTCDPPKIFHLGDQFWGISREFPRNQLQEMVLEKFSGNSSKKVTSVGESGEIPHFCYLGCIVIDIYLLLGSFAFSISRATILIIRIHIGESRSSSSYFTKQIEITHCDSSLGR